MGDICSIWPELIIEPWHEIYNNVVCATSKASDQPAHTRSLIRAFGSPLKDSMSVKLLTEHHLEFLRRLHRLVWGYTCQNATLLIFTCHGSIIWCIGLMILCICTGLTEPSLCIYTRGCESLRIYNKMATNSTKKNRWLLQIIWKLWWNHIL